MSYPLIYVVFISAFVSQFSSSELFYCTSYHSEDVLMADVLFELYGSLFLNSVNGSRFLLPNFCSFDCSNVYVLITAQCISICMLKYYDTDELLLVILSLIGNFVHLLLP